jgi:uncharacterized tellurite resistance protein B-like protein
MTFDELSKDDRLRLMRFVCSFAWADLNVHEKERRFVRSLMKKLKLNASESKQVEEWLKVPPRPEEVDPQMVPPEHRALFLSAVGDVIAADGEVHPEERESFILLDELIR